jgi:hypothetical protein
LNGGAGDAGRYAVSPNALNHGLMMNFRQRINSENMHYQNCQQEEMFLANNGIYFLNLSFVKPSL